MEYPWISHIYQPLAAIIPYFSPIIPPKIPYNHLKSLKSPMFLWFFYFCPWFSYPFSPMFLWFFYFCPWFSYPFYLAPRKVTSPVGPHEISWVPRSSATATRVATSPWTGDLMVIVNIWGFMVNDS